MNSVISTYAALGLAIVTEVAGATSLQLSEQLTKLIPTSIMGACYFASLYFLSLALRAMPIGRAYAIWSGLGIVLISLISHVKFRQALYAGHDRRRPHRRRRRYRGPLLEIYRSLIMQRCAGSS